MTEGQLVTPRAHGGANAAGAWRSVVEACGAAAGPFEPSLLSAWRRELDDVQQRVAALCGDVPVGGVVIDPLPAGVHALLALAGARIGSVWRPDQLLGAAAAAELAHRAALQHEAVRDQSPAALPPGGIPKNKEHVLGGDWSITQAARLAADIGPSAYRVLVRGWGAAQLTRLRTGECGDPHGLFDTAISLGALTAGVPTETALRSREGRSAPARVLRWAARL